MWLELDSLRAYDSKRRERARRNRRRRRQENYLTIFACSSTRLGVPFPELGVSENLIGPGFRGPPGSQYLGPVEMGDMVLSGSRTRKPGAHQAFRSRLQQFMQRRYRTQSMRRSQTFASPLALTSCGVFVGPASPSRDSYFSSGIFLSSSFSFSSLF